MRSTVQYRRTTYRTLFTVLAAAFACAALPAAATAQDQPGFDYFQSFFLNTPGEPLLGISDDRHSTVGDDEPDGQAFFPCSTTGVCPEDLTCGPTEIGSTFWHDYFPHRPGAVRIEVVSLTPGWRPVLATFRYNNPGARPDFGVAPCSVAGSGGIATVGPFMVPEGTNWSVAVGGDKAQSVSTGDFSLNLTFDPDSDRDTVLDSADGCDDQTGPASNRGCPVPPPPVVIARPPPPVIRPTSSLSPGPFFRRSRGRIVYLGVKIGKLIVRQLPAGTRVQVSCTRGACPVQVRTAGASGRVEFPRMRNRKIRQGRQIIIRSTKAGSVGSYIRYVIGRNKAAKAELCTQPGSRTPQRKC